MFWQIYMLGLGAALISGLLLGLRSAYISTDNKVLPIVSSVLLSLFSAVPGIGVALIVILALR